ncbi:ATP-binding protein [Streptomyces sp. NPDC056653]|uniref:ATP-binding protein n=1 Tax=Streptomyces sp. NPDC056653 TaxID=3345894 RepID=UPI0036CA609E
MHTLPRDVAAFTGREAELERLTRSAGPGEVIVIHTVDGMPGVGKTALATRAANILAPRFPDGQLFIRLHAHTDGQLPADPSETLAALLASRGISTRLIPQGLEERAAMWRDHAADKKILLVLDDAADNTQIEPLLPAAPGCLVLVTSRRRLVALDGAGPLPLDVLPPDVAARLFTHLAHRTSTPADSPALTRAVLLCGHLPLAIALLAGRLAHHPTWTIPAFTDEFAAAQDRLGELEAGNRAVRSAFDLSYNDLPPTRKRLFRRLGLHPGTDTDAYATAALDNIPLTQARRELRALHTDHLIDEPTPGRYRLHDLLRTYTQSLTTQDPPQDREQTTIRLLDYYQHTAQKADLRLARPHTTPPTTPLVETPDLNTRDQALTWLRTEQPNLLAATDHAATHHHHTHTIALTAATAALLQQDGPWHQAANLHLRAATTAHHHTNPHDEADALNNLGRVRRLLGQYAAAGDVHEEALALYRDLGDRQGEADALNALGRARRPLGQYAAAGNVHEEALALYRDLGDRRGQAHALSDLGRVRRLLGQYVVAGDLQEQALALYRDLGDRRGQAHALNHLGRVRRLLGRYVVAGDLHEQALALYRDLGDRRGQAHALSDLGRVRRLLGQYVVAGELQEQALALYRDLGHRLGQANALNELGRVRYLLGRYVVAGDLYEEALTLYRDLGDRHGEAEVLNNMSALVAETVGPGDGLAVYQQALLLAREVAVPLEEARALDGSARCQLRTGDRETAIENLRQALAIYQRLGVLEAQPAADLLASLAAEAPDSAER